MLQKNRLRSQATQDLFLSSVFSADIDFADTDIPTQAPVRPDGIAPATAATVYTDGLIPGQQVQAVSDGLLALNLAFHEDFGQQMRQASIQAAVAFVRQHGRAIRLPNFSAEPSGNVLGTWRRGKEVLTVRFVDQGPVHFALVREVPGTGELKRTWNVVPANDLCKPMSETAALLMP